MMLDTCKIQWIDETGQPTPDSNPAMGYVKMLKHRIDSERHSYWISESKWYPICGRHLKEYEESRLAENHWIIGMMGE